MKRLFLVLLVVLCLPGLCTAEEAWQLWTGGEIDYEHVPELKGGTYTTICDTQKLFGGKYFLHGLAIEEYHGKWYASYAFNKTKENVYGEQCFYQVSEDGQNWSEPKEIKPNATAYSASHGVLFVDGDSLYCMMPAVDFLTGPWGIVAELHRYREAEDTWEFMHNCAASFWPCARPMRMDSGKWIAVGAGGGDTKVLLSGVNDLTDWTNVKVKRAMMGSETTFFSNGQEVVLLMRPKAATVESSLGRGEKRFVIGAAYSADGGETFTRAQATELFCSPSKLYGGMLSDGRPYIVFNQSILRAEARDRLLMAVGDPGTMSVNRLYVLAEHNGAISYPYAVERDGTLYVAYSKSIANMSNGNQNDAVLAKVPISNIP